MIDHCISQFQQEQKKIVYQTYITDALKALTENTAKYVGGNAVTKRYIDLINQKPQDNRTGDEIAADVIKKAGLVVTK